MIGDLKLLARLFGLAVLPDHPTVPASRRGGTDSTAVEVAHRIREPIPTSAYDDSAREDPMLVFELSDDVRETIQRTIYRRLISRRNIFSADEFSEAESAARNAISAAQTR